MKKIMAKKTGKKEMTVGELARRTDQNFIKFEKKFDGKLNDLARITNIAFSESEKRMQSGFQEIREEMRIGFQNVRIEARETEERLLTAIRGLEAKLPQLQNT